VYATRVDVEGRLPLIFTTEHDITERRQLELERESAMNTLEKAYLEIRQLRGTIPICGHCKEIRNDEGAWEELEAYISHHSEAQFSHGICPKCAAEYFPEFS